MPAVISDTSCLIFLGKIEQLALLTALFGEVWVTPAVAAEYQLSLPTWIRVQTPERLPTADQVPVGLGLGERSAIGLALMHPDSLLILDDERAKQAAKRLGIGCIGTLGIIKLAKEVGLLVKVRPIIEQLRTVGGMWLSDTVVERVCREAGE